MRGKEAAQAARRRAEEALGQAEELKRQLANERANSSEEISALKGEICRLRNEMTRLVTEGARAEVVRLRDAFDQQLAHAKAGYSERAEQAMDKLASWENIPSRLCLEIATVLGTDAGWFLNDRPNPNRHARRRTESLKKTRHLVSHLEDRAVAGRGEGDRLALIDPHGQKADWVLVPEHDVELDPVWNPSADDSREESK